MAVKHIAEVGSALSVLLSLFLEALELCEATGNFEVGRTWVS